MSRLEPYSDAEDSPTDNTETSGNFHVVPTLADDDDDDDDDLNGRQQMQQQNLPLEHQYTEVEDLPLTRIDDTVEEPTFTKTFIEPLINLILSILKMMLLPFAKFFFAPTAQRTFIKTTAFVIALAWILVTSIIAYVLFYNRYVPPITHIQQVYFDHGPSTPTLDALVDMNRHKNKAIPLRHEQSYDLLLRLHVPTSDINFEVGNFMVNIKLYTENGTLIMDQARPSILRYQSNTQRVMRVFAKALPLVLGFTEESQHLDITLIEDFTEIKSRAVKKVALSISDARLQIYDSKLMVLANFKGLRLVIEKVTKR
ncbi:putative adipose-regulatory protein-domain-containing protein [Mycotypha africana]|uniref:putative adipose-regulatory protein-domain-containing protein n=1 Tax=Mycotypha africana TaxID=64632 RepID=UPI002301184D|nr:putative adipose-regulatory protein-domain-containing protein [Mycotypha africana]KAI8991291.1 putative adipose-regulatory protein-domain-containing protein [Mycotypha africana]